MADTKSNDDLIDNQQSNIDADVEAQKKEADMNEILKKDYIETDAPKYNIDLFGLKYQIDKSTIQFFLPGLVVYVATFMILGLHNSDCVLLKIMFLVGIFFWVLQIHNRRNEKLQHVTGESVSKHRARDSTIVILSIITLFTVFSKDKRDKENAGLLGVSILSLIIGSFWYAHEDTPELYRNKRNIHISSLTVALMMFALFIIRNYLC